ncbi:MAG: hypothetical protein JJU00_14915 [Opitutales bacterium]|nr:hypothetical protein [Opitutales bacterium]
MILTAGSFLWLAQGGFDWEALIPLVFILLYALSQILGSGKKKDKKKPSQQSSASPAERQQETEQESRARQIREEIQRKIAERQQTEAPAHRGLSESTPPRYDPNRPEHEQRRAPAAASRRELESSRRPAAETSRRELTPSAAQASADDPTAAVHKELSKQRERLAAARREREAAHRKARDIMRQGQSWGENRGAAAPDFSWEISDMSPARYRADLIRLLSDPAGAQKAVLFREVLGPPLAYRDPTSPNERIP